MARRGQWPTRGALSARQFGGADQGADDHLVADLDTGGGLDGFVVYGQRSLIGRGSGAAGEGAEQGENEGVAHIEILFNRAEAGRGLYVRRGKPGVAEFSLCAALPPIRHLGRHGLGGTTRGLQGDAQ
jgi:hypothetical protein